VFGATGHIHGISTPLSTPLKGQKETSPPVTRRSYGLRARDEVSSSALYDALDVADPTYVSAPTFVRAQAGLHTDLAQARLARAEYDDEHTHPRQVRLLACRTGSVRQRRRVDLLSAQL
jgi:hypothetical protein